MSQISHAIRVVSQRTGLTTHVIRVWEKRYGAVTPVRTPTNRRLYSEIEVDRLLLLRQATELGHSIGLVARLSTSQLREMIAGARTAPQDKSPPGHEQTGHGFVGPCIDAVRRLDAHALESELRQASLALGSQGLLRKVIGPLAQAIGQPWQQGEITAAQEHLASAVIRTFLGQLARPYATSELAPNLVVATPSGQLHELGAVIVAAAAAAHGWRITYLGAGLPAAEIAGAAIATRARAVALSIVYPADDAGLPAELDNLRRSLPPEMAILVGGRATPAYHDVIERLGFFAAAQLEDLDDLLDRLRDGGR